MTRTFTPDEIAALIARLEAAKGPDREIDAEVWLLVTPGATRQKWSYTHEATGRLCEVDETRQADRRLIIVPDYTASIDAAQTLVPAHHDWALHVDNGAAIAGCSPASEDGCDYSNSHGATPAIALVIAALKARASIRASGTRLTGEPGAQSSPAPEASGLVGRGFIDQGEGEGL